MATMSSRPEEPRPLSEHEQRVLAEIGEGLAEQYPRLGPRLAPTRYSLLDEGLTAAACVAIGAVLLPQGWAMLLVVIAVNVVLVRAARRGMV